MIVWVTLRSIYTYVSLEICNFSCCCKMVYGCADTVSPLSGALNHNGKRSSHGLNCTAQRVPPTPSGNRHSHKILHELKIDPTITVHRPELADGSRRNDHVRSIVVLPWDVSTPYLDACAAVNGILPELNDGVTDLSLVHSWAGIVMVQVCVYTAIAMLAMLQRQRCMEPYQVSGSWMRVLS